MYAHFTSLSNIAYTSALDTGVRRYTVFLCVCSVRSRLQVTKSRIFITPAAPRLSEGGQPALTTTTQAGAWCLVLLCLMFIKVMGFFSKSSGKCFKVLGKQFLKGTQVSIYTYNTTVQGLQGDGFETQLRLSLSCLVTT